MTLRVGFTVEEMAVHRTDDRVAVLSAETLEVLRRLGNPADNFTHCRTTHQAFHPHRASVVGGPLEHVTIDFVDDAARIRRTWLLGRRERRNKDQRADEDSYTKHGKPPESSRLEISIASAMPRSARLGRL